MLKRLLKLIIDARQQQADRQVAEFLQRVEYRFESPEYLQTYVEKGKLP